MEKRRGEEKIDKGCGKKLRVLILCFTIGYVKIHSYVVVTVEL